LRTYAHYIDPEGVSDQVHQANIHSFLETDDRVAAVVKYMDEAIAELDNMDSTVSSYKIHLNASWLSYLIRDSY
jgi:hypothetical protein